MGHNIIVDGIPRQVIGVMPATFRFLDRDAAFLLPLQLDRRKTVLGSDWSLWPHLVLRLKTYARDGHQDSIGRSKT